MKKLILTSILIATFTSVAQAAVVVSRPVIVSKPIVIQPKPIVSKPVTQPNKLKPATQSSIKPTITPVVIVPLVSNNDCAIKDNKKRCDNSN